VEQCVSGFDAFGEGDPRRLMEDRNAFVAVTTQRAGVVFGSPPFYIPDDAWPEDEFFLALYKVCGNDV
jgi:hypothetical protein